MALSILCVAQNLTLLISNEAHFLFRVKDQVQLLSNEISLLSSILQDANEKCRSTNEVKEWLNQVRDVIMEAENLIDFFIFGAEQRRHRNILTRYISYPKILYNLHKLGMTINDSNEKIKNLSIKRSTLGLATSAAGQSSTSMMITNEQGQSFHRRDRLEEFYVIRFEEEENEIVKKLLTHVEPLRSCPTVVSIVGMGGSGKTTLARQVYNRNDVKEHFQTCAWISVSQQYRIKDLLHVIIEQIIRPLTTEEVKELDVESLTCRLSSHLKEKTYLIVFDDLWRPEDWHVLRQALPIQGEGYQSRVLVTTRKGTVARYADPHTNPHHKRLLNEDASWKLFLTTVTRSKNASCPKDLEDLEDLGRKIVRKCHGLPLAIIVLGGLLSTKPETHIAWSKVLDSVNWELNQNEGSCKQILALSYTDLPDHLKPCFLYVGLFPKDYEILRHKLIWLWVAEGFIQPRGNLTMEEVAEDYLEELIQRSMIQATGRSYDKRVIGCHMHDLVRDLAISEAEQERFLQILESDHLISPKKSRRLSIMEPTGGMYGSPTHALNQSSTPIHPRSILCFSKTIERNMWMNSRSSSYGAMKLLRVLDLEGVSYIPRSLLKEIGKLILLKYLSLRHTNVKELPSSIGDLQNLQTLDLCHTHLRQLPVTIMKLKQLRNFLFCNYFGGASQSFDCHLDHMTNLRTLFLHEGKWMEGRLEKLRNLRELRIATYGKSTLSPYKEALSNSIRNLTCLRGLKLVDSVIQSNKDAVMLPISFSDHLELYNMILVGITGIQDFPPNLTTLYLRSQRGQRIDQLMEALKKLPKLRCLMFVRACLGSKIFIPADGFPQLEELGLIELDDLEDLIVEEGALPNLKVLKIERCGRLKRLPHGLKQVVSLQELTMSGMSKGLYYNVRKDMGEDWEIIQHIPSIARSKSDMALVRGSIAFGQWC